MCNIQPNVTPLYKTRVYVRTTLHRGERSHGSLIGAVRLPSGQGYYHYPGDDEPGTDNWGGAELMNRLIQKVGTLWAQSHPTPRFGFGDISRQNGGEFFPHGEHENGLDVDIYYMGKEIAPNINYEGRIDLTNSYDLTNRYDRTRTIELLNLFAANASIYRIIVNPKAGISAADVPGVNIIVDVQTKHTDHFHLSLNDPDGPDSNNCP